jgi:hypothetical protein
MGGDLARSLLVFAKGRPLGKYGLDWLKIHCINLTELKKKCPIEERLIFANQVLDDILDSANRPLEGNKWWMKSEEPWKTLAACIEIRDALDHPGGPEEFISHLPIHQDGSCNGLQHYSAMGRDVLGATFVNVVPSEGPQDIYGEIAAIIERKRNSDEINASGIIIFIIQFLPALVRTYNEGLAFACLARQHGLAEKLQSKISGRRPAELQALPTFYRPKSLSLLQAFPAINMTL